MIRGRNQRNREEDYNKITSLWNVLDLSIESCGRARRIWGRKLALARIQRRVFGSTEHRIRTTIENSKVINLNFIFKLHCHYCRLNTEEHIKETFKDLWHFLKASPKIVVKKKALLRKCLSKIFTKQRLEERQVLEKIKAESSPVTNRVPAQKLANWRTGRVFNELLLYGTALKHRAALRWALVIFISKMWGLSRECFNQLKFEDMTITDGEGLTIRKTDPKSSKIVLKSYVWEKSTWKVFKFIVSALLRLETEEDADSYIFKGYKNDPQKLFNSLHMDKITRSVICRQSFIHLQSGEYSELRFLGLDRGEKFIYLTPTAANRIKKEINKSEFSVDYFSLGSADQERQGTLFKTTPQAEHIEYKSIYSTQIDSEACYEVEEKEPFSAKFAVWKQKAKSIAQRVLEGVAYERRNPYRKMADNAILGWNNELAHQNSDGSSCISGWVGHVLKKEAQRIILGLKRWALMEYLNSYESKYGKKPTATMIIDPRIYSKIMIDYRLEKAQVFKAFRICPDELWDFSTNKTKHQLLEWSSVEWICDPLRRWRLDSKHEDKKQTPEIN